MISEVLKYKDVLVRFGDSISLDVSSLGEWNVAKEMTIFLEAFLEATKSFSTVRRPCSHTYMKEVWTIRTLLLEDDMNSNQSLRNLSNEMQAKFYKYWENPNMILTLACVFDPRSKLQFVEFCFGVAYGIETFEYTKKMKGVQSLLRNCYDEYERKTCNTVRATSSGSPQVQGITDKKRKLEMRFFQFKEQNRHLQPKKSELDNYLEEASVGSDEENFDIFQWWKKNSDLYPVLAKMTRDFLRVQVSTVASESAFSATGRLTDHLHNSMSAETIEALVCSKDWFGSIDGTFDLNQFRPFMQAS